MSMTTSEESTTKPVLARSLPALSCTPPQTQRATARGTQTATTPHSSRIERHTVRGWGGERVTHRTGAAAGVRRRAAAAAPTRPSLPYPAPPRARVPSGRYAQLSAEPADGSQLLPPRPPARGAAAPSSLVVPVRHFTAIISWTNFSKSFRHSTQERNLSAIYIPLHQSRSQSTWKYSESSRNSYGV